MITLKTSIGEFEVPTVTQEITFGAFLDFRVHENRFFEASEAGEKEADQHIRKALSFIVKGDLSKLPYHLPKDDIRIILSTAFNFSHLSITRLWGHIVCLIEAYGKEEDPDINSSYSIEYKGETFFLEPDTARRFLGAKTYSYGEVAEVEEIDRQLGREIEKKGDPTRSLEYERELRVMAVLLRKEGEKLPFHPAERREFLEGRMNHFKDLPMTAVLDVRFFLHATLIQSAKLLITDTFSEDAPTSAPAKPLKNPKPKPEQPAKQNGAEGSSAIG